MTTRKLELTPYCCFEATRYSGVNITEVSLEYIERSPDHYYSSSTSITINKEEALRIIAFLSTAFSE